MSSQCFHEHIHRSISVRIGTATQCAVGCYWVGSGFMSKMRHQRLSGSALETTFDAEALGGKWGA
jgi:hypothetical protein